MDKWLIFVAIGFIIIMSYGVYTLHYLMSDSAKCLANPLEFGVKVYSEKVSEMTCTCSFLDYKYIPMLITKNGTSAIYAHAENNVSYQAINLSGLFG